MELRIIKTDEQHRRYLEEARRLAKADPAPGTDSGARLELLAKLIDDYERERFTFRKPAPIEAIRFRMETPRTALERPGWMFLSESWRRCAASTGSAS
jgi:HTH-type transcriptional regulator/antitoxin HigA